VGPVVPVPTTLTPSVGSVAFTYLGEATAIGVDVLDQTGAPLFVGGSSSWVSDNEDVATVSDAGLVTAVGNGATTLRVTVADAQASVSVSVEQVASLVRVDADSVVLRDPTDQKAVVARAFDASGSELASAVFTWSIDDESVATVDAAGHLTAVGTGSTVVYASIGALVDSVSVRVEPQLTLVRLGVLEPAAPVATEIPLSVRVEDLLGSAYGGATVAWSVDGGSGSITSVPESVSDGTGHAGAVWKLGERAGMQRAFATLESRGISVRVEWLATALAGPAVGASLVADSILLSARGETAFLSPEVVDAYGNPAAPTGVTWTSADPAVAAVAADGLVTGEAEGATWITASVGTPVDSILVTVQMRGAITITFDDGWLSVHENARPVLEEVGLRGNVGVYTEAVGFPAYMTEEHLDQLHDAGWSMVSHTVSHDSLSTLSAGELDFEMRASQSWLEARGYAGSNVFVAPYHDFGPTERAAAAQYYTAARGTSATAFVPDSLASWQPENPYELTGLEAANLPFTSVAGRDRLRDILQRTLDEGLFVDLFFHQIAPEDVDALRATLTVVAEFRDRVLPYHELYPIWARAVF
jgi:peptidoglycan/xylan/chitin deacetylase (PgdA/CDA1 family)